MNRKTIIISSAVAILVIAIIGAFLLYPKTEVTPGGDGPAGGTFPISGGTDIGGLPPVGGGDDSGLSPLGVEIGGQKKLIRLTANATSGMGIGTSTVRYVEKSTGHVYEVGFDGQERRRISNTTILRTFDSYWSPNADKLVLRYFGENEIYPTLKTFLIELNVGTTTSSFDGVFLPKTVRDVVTSPTEDKIFYLDSGALSTVGVITDYKNKGRKTVLTTPFGDFSAEWPSGNTITLLTRPSGLIGGNFYLLNIKTGAMDKIIADIEGLTARASPDLERVVFSQTRSFGGIETNLLDVSEGSVTSLGLRTFPEKCVWSKIDTEILYCAAPNAYPVAMYPDDWYQGLVSFTDSLWKIDLSTGVTDLLISSTGADVINISLDEAETALFFTNKEDGTLWSVKLGE